MKTDRVEATVVLILTVAVLILAGSLAYMGVASTFAPRCQEDAVLIGYGDFSEGRWERYECGPSFDDYSPSN